MEEGGRNAPRHGVIPRCKRMKRKTAGSARTGRARRGKEVNTPLPSKQKIDAVAELTEKLSRSKSVVIADYRGLTVAEVNRLRTKMREANVDYQVVKNRLFKIAASENGFDSMGTVLKGPSAFAIGYDDPVAPAKVVSDFSKDIEKLKIKGGWFGTQALDVAGVQSLANLPSREQLLARMLGSLNSPVTKLAIGLNQAISKIAYAMKAVAEAKEG